MILMTMGCQLRAKSTVPVAKEGRNDFLLNIYCIRRHNPLIPSKSIWHLRHA